MMEENINDYVFIDGVHLRKDILITMAKKTGSVTIAEHYMGFLLHHAYMYKMDELIKEVGKIREMYQLIQLPSQKPLPGSDKYKPNFTPKNSTPEEKARAIYKKMSMDKRTKVLKESLFLLNLENDTLFNNRSCWIGLYLVVKDRLDGNITHDGFHDLAEKFTPKGWPQKKKISKHTLSNITRYIKYDDRALAYYEMEDNPWEELCGEFWKKLLDQILTSN